ncbi:hypothetical protein TL16_g03418 [Triparma laevis f. inornata]|uniref:Uncharacterized protein n=1 Tax=Triparma laevis f. inornata TaxID=1714386 RepID=A0A9W6ZYG2_9STRA|nr:hypothetical protein TL16_g03418 [Triparma laevis f. inornata]
MLILHSLRFRTSNPAAVHCSSAPSSAPSSPPASPQNVTKSLPPSPPPSPPPSLSDGREARALIYKTTADDSGSDYASESDVEPDVEPLPPKKFTKHDPFEFLLNSKPSPLLSSPHVLKTVKNSTPIWRTFLSSLKSGNAFHTSLTLLPETGKFMRLYGSVNEYTLGVIFELPTTEYESETFSDTKLLTSYCWASGYSAKTEFNLTSRGELFNGRGDNLVSISELIKQNEAFSSSIPSSVPIKLHGRDTSTPMSSVPFNEIYIRISGTPPYNLLNGLGPPIGIFSRSSCYCDLVELLKKREVFEEEGLRLFFIRHEDGVRELGGRGEVELLKVRSRRMERFERNVLDDDIFKT